jgi:hypothetical protein
MFSLMVNKVLVQTDRYIYLKTYPSEANHDTLSLLREKICEEMCIGKSQ